MSNETGSYECEYCGTEFESGPKKAGHISQNHRDDQQREDFIHALQRLATELGHSPTMSDMDEKGRYTRKAYITEFGTWNDALREAGLEINKPSTVSKAEVVEAIQSLSEKLIHPPTVEEMNEYGQYSRKAASKHFGSWNNALRSVGFEPHHEEIPREELLEEIHRLAEKLGRAPFLSDLKSDGQYSLRGYIRRFGSWNEAITTAGYEPFTPFTGPDHPLWAGAEKRERLWYGPNWKTIRKRALERDSYECQHPGCQISSKNHRDQFSKSLHVHHIIPLRSFQDDDGEIDYERANMLENLVTICVEHHTQWEELSPLRPDVP